MHVSLRTRVGHHRERKKNGDGEDRIRDLTQTGSIDAKRALYQLSYVPLVGFLLLTLIGSSWKYNLNMLVESKCYNIVIHASIR